MNLYNALKQCVEIESEYIHCENDGDYLIQRDGDTLKIFFEWSDGIEDWKNNFRFLAVPCKPYKDMKNLWFVHRGFLKVWKSIKQHIEADIKNPEIRRIEIVGYSHGAAIALLCYEYCVYNRPEIVVEGVGFGCPRVCWGPVPKAVRSRFSGFQTVRNGKDIVTHVPPIAFGFRHVGAMVKIGQTNPIKDHFDSEYLKNLKGVE